MERDTSFNIGNWIEIYERTDFGNRYPSSYLVSVFHRIIKEKFPKTQEVIKTLDFGCSFGANSKMLMDYGLDVYGVDVSDNAIHYCIQNRGFEPEKFVACDILSENCYLNEKYMNKFDFIVASGVLCYFSDLDMERVLEHLYKFLKKDGIIYANMPSYNYGYLNGEVDVRNIDEAGMVRIESSGAASRPLYVRCVKDKLEMRELFHMFEEIATLRTITEIKEENEEFHFIGRKPSD